MSCYLPSSRQPIVIQDNLIRHTPIDQYIALCCTRTHSHLPFLFVLIIGLACGSCVDNLSECVPEPSQPGCCSGTHVLSLFLALSYSHVFNPFSVILADNNSFVSFCFVLFCDKTAVSCAAGGSGSCSGLLLCSTAPDFICSGQLDCYIRDPNAVLDEISLGLVSPTQQAPLLPQDTQSFELTTSDILQQDCPVCVNSMFAR